MNNKVEYYFTTSYDSKLYSHNPNSSTLITTQQNYNNNFKNKVHNFKIIAIKKYIENKESKFILFP